MVRVVAWLLHFHKNPQLIEPVTQTDLNMTSDWPHCDLQHWSSRLALCIVARGADGQSGTLCPGPRTYTRTLSRRQHQSVHWALTTSHGVFLYTTMWYQVITITTLYSAVFSLNCSKVLYMFDNYNKSLSLGCLAHYSHADMFNQTPCWLLWEVVSTAIITMQKLTCNLFSLLSIARNSRYKINLNERWQFTCEKQRLF